MIKKIAESATHIECSNSRTDSTTTIELIVIGADGRSKAIMLNRFRDISKQDAVDALIRAKENNPSISNNISMTRIERTYFY